MFQFHYQGIRPLTTAHLAQTMSLLSLTSAELSQQIDTMLASNPALEMVEERRCPTCHRVLSGSAQCPVCSRQQKASVDEPIVFISPRDDFCPGSGYRGEDLPEDNDTTAVEELPTYVFRQIAPELAADDRKMAAYLLTHLDEDGLLTIEPLEIARYFHYPLERVEKVRRLVQRADPVGVGSNTPQESCLVQLEVLKETRIVPDLAETLIRDGMDLLSRRQYVELARQCSVSYAQVRQVARFISKNLNPFPARTHWGDGRQGDHGAGTQVYYQPDILISYSNEDQNAPLMVEIILPLRGTLQVNPLYRQAMQQVTEEQKEGLKEDLEKATLFVKCLQQRNHTMRRLMQRVVALQRSFILQGEKHLKPVTRAQIALDLEVHESTISRAVANKAVQLPNGRIIPLAEFFDRSLGIRTELREIIAQEARPLSDADLVSLLAQRGYVVARRTVAKYRAMEGILPANLRQATRS